MLTWLLFRSDTGATFSSAPDSFSRSDAPEARFIAALVPLANGVRLAAIGTGVLRNEAAVKAISRKGDPG